MHTCCAFVRGSLGTASHTQKKKCKKELETDFFKHGHVVGMYWENIARSMVERAHRDARQLDVPLFCLQAADQRHARKNKTIDKQLTHQLLTVPNPHRTGKLQGMLLVHENMIVRLSDVLAPHLGLVKDKMAMVVKVDLHHEDQERLRHREPLVFVISCLNTWPRVSGWNYSNSLKMLGEFIFFMSIHVHRMSSAKKHLLPDLLRVGR